MKLYKNIFFLTAIIHLTTKTMKHDSSALQPIKALSGEMIIGPEAINQAFCKTFAHLKKNPHWLPTLEEEEQFFNFIRKELDEQINLIYQHLDDFSLKKKDAYTKNTFAVLDAQILKLQNVLIKLRHKK